jgi:hypothetical protein
VNFCLTRLSFVRKLRPREVHKIDDP